jgi:hypothetical protein
MSNIGELVDLEDDDNPDKPEIEQLRIKDEIQQIMAMPAGRRFVFRKLSESGLYSAIFIDGARRAAFVEGQRAVGAKLLAEVMQYAPSQYFTMIQENQHV